MSSWPLNGKKGGNRKHSKIDTLPPRNEGHRGRDDYGWQRHLL